MRPIKFRHANLTLKGPKGGNIQDLPAWSNGTYCVSCWRMTWRDRLTALFSGKLWLWVMSGRTQPPVVLSVEDPDLRAMTTVSEQDIKAVTAAVIKRVRKAEKKL